MHEDYKEILNVLKFFPVGKLEKVSPIGQRKINCTYYIKTNKGEFILQKLHTIFKYKLLYDIDKVTKHLHKHGFTTPLLIKTKNNKLGIKNKKEIWRMFTYIPGKTIIVGNREQIISAAKLVGKFHKVLSSLKYDFKFHIPKFHETEKTIINLVQTLKKHKSSEKYKTISPIARAIIASHKKLKKETKSIKIKRIIHDDLRIENIRFSKNGKAAICILDLDTLGKNEINIELGDIIRSWTNKSHELDIKNSKFDIQKFKIFLKHYLNEATFLTKDEILSIPKGVEKLSLDLAARFAIDAFEEKYFSLSPDFNSRYEQNLTYAKAQLNFYISFKKKKNEVKKYTQKLANSLS